ncbi:hypothetical protein BH11BAC2_BH11BAC2_26010 [soil metagenome]
MFRDHLENITGISIFPMFSLIVFFLFFTFLLVYLYKADKNELIEISKLPLNQPDSPEKS